MSKYENIELKKIKISGRSVSNKYIEVFNSYLDKVVIPYFENQLTEKDKEIGLLRFTIDEMSNANKNIHKAIKVLDKQNRYLICKEIRETFDNKDYELYGDNHRILSIQADEFNNKLDKIEKGE